MYFLALLVALCALLPHASAVPTTFALSSPIAISNPQKGTYAADLAAVVAYAQSHIAPANINSNDEEAATASAANENVHCGSYSHIGGRFSFPTYINEFYCNDTNEAEETDKFYNYYCGFCIVFDGCACQGAIRWSGGPEKEGHDVRGAKSYFRY